jgi:hypothetical protein
MPASNITAPTTTPVVPPVPVVPVQTISDETWAGWFRTHFSVFVLLFMCLMMFLFILHASHHQADSALLQFLEGHSQTFVGALVGALTTGGISQLVNRAGTPK